MEKSVRMQVKLLTESGVHTYERVEKSLVGREERGSCVFFWYDYLFSMSIFYFCTFGGKNLVSIFLKL